MQYCVFICMGSRTLNTLGILDTTRQFFSLKRISYSSLRRPTCTVFEHNLYKRVLLDFQNNEVGPYVQNIVNGYSRYTFDLQIAELQTPRA